MDVIFAGLRVDACPVAPVNPDFGDQCLFVKKPPWAIVKKPTFARTGNAHTAMSGIDRLKADSSISVIALQIVLEEWMTVR